LALRPEGSDDDGFTTAVFAALTFALSLIAIGSLMVARQGLTRAEHDARQDRERWVLDGIATSAEAQLLSENGSPSLRWSEPSAFGQVVVSVEPESLKMSPATLDRPENQELVAAMIGQADAGEVARQAAGLGPAADGLLHREQVVELNASPRWRECAETLVSPYSRLSAFNLQPISAPTNAGEDPHAGQLWRITVDVADGGWFDRVVRMTGKASDPAAIIEQTSGRTVGNHRASCLPDALREAGRSL
jgi:hypothetical protein